MDKIRATLSQNLKLEASGQKVMKKLIDTGQKSASQRKSDMMISSALSGRYVKNKVKTALSAPALYPFRLKKRCIANVQNV